MKKYLYIKGTTNYDVCVTSLTDVTVASEEDLTTLHKISKLIKTTATYNWNINDYQDDDLRPRQMYPELSANELDLFEDYLPYSEDGIHTIEEIKIFHIGEEETLYENN